VARLTGIEKDKVGIIPNQFALDHRQKNTPEKEHSDTFKYPKLFPKTQQQMEHFEMRDGSRKYLLS